MSGTRFSTGKVKGVSERKLNLFHEAAAEVKVKKTLKQERNQTFRRKLHVIAM